MTPSSRPSAIAVTGGFDDVRARDLRFLQEAAKFGELTVVLWSDEAVRTVQGAPPKFPFAERRYFLEAVRYVTRVLPVPGPVDPHALPTPDGFRFDAWVDVEQSTNEARAAFCRRSGLNYHVLDAHQVSGLPDRPTPPCPPGRRKVVVTGCYDWFHTGHIRFFEEVSAYGDLFVIVGHDANIRLLKGAGHPLFPQAERRYVVDSIRHVTQTLVSSGEGWLDADPEIQRLQPDLYAVNEDGDKGGKRDYCVQRGIEYLVLKRTPAPGLSRRSSTDLRGF